MRKMVFVACAILLLLSVSVLQVAEMADANPYWGTSATPIPPITDPPQITITSPSSRENNNPVLLNITIVQPDSWVSKHNMSFPKSWIDNSDSVVVGQNTLRSVTCIIDGEPFILWQGTHFGSGVTYYLPRITQFSAVMNVSKGQHNLQVDVIAVSDYVTEGIIPFAEREYTIHANASTTFYLTSGSDSVWSPTIDGAKSSYAIWKASDPASTPYELLPPSTIAPSENYSVPPLSSLSLKVHLIYGESCSGLIIIKGGSGNDINFRIIDPQGKVYLDFGRISNEKSFHFFTPNRPGNFTLVFDNEFSVFSSKEVDVFSNTYPDNVFEFAGFSITFWVIILVVILLVTSSVALVVWLSRRRQK